MVKGQQLDVRMHLCALHDKLLALSEVMYNVRVSIAVDTVLELSPHQMET